MLLCCSTSRDCLTHPAATLSHLPPAALLKVSARSPASYCLRALSKGVIWLQPLSRRPAVLQEESACIECKQCVWRCRVLHSLHWVQAGCVALQDEAACIGCKQCVWCASGVFRMEPEFGRSRAFAQWCDTEDRIQVGSPRLPSSLPARHHQSMHCSKGSA